MIIKSISNLIWEKNYSRECQLVFGAHVSHRYIFLILLAVERANWELKKMRKYVKIIINNDKMFQKFVYRFVIDWMKKTRQWGVECWINSIKYINNIGTIDLVAVSDTKIYVTNVLREKDLSDDDHMKHATKWKTQKWEKEKGKVNCIYAMQWCLQNKNCRRNNWIELRKINWRDVVCQ